MLSISQAYVKLFTHDVSEKSTVMCGNNSFSFLWKLVIVCSMIAVERSGKD